jgi:ssDNA-binding Zn-finger/Zn-ribbon topoisomerase 1
MYTARRRLPQRHRWSRANLVNNDDLFEPYDKLLQIEVLGRRVEVPENNRLLRCFQFLSMRSISYGDFCWNGDCTNCQFWYRDADEAEPADKTALACRFRVRQGLVVTRLNACVRLEDIDK